MNLEISTQVSIWKRIKNHHIAAAAGVALAVSALGFTGFAGSAEASKPCVTPGTGILIGALNMILDPTMDQIMADHTAPQGDAGMFTAVGASSSGCS